MRLIFFYYINLGVILFAWITSILRFRNGDKGLNIFSVLLGLTFVAECIAYYCAKRYRNNMPVYSIFNLLQFFLVCLYFNHSIDVFRRKNIGLYIGVGGVVLGIGNIIFLQPLNNLNNYFLFFEGILTISLALFSFTRLMLLQQMSEEEIPLYHNLHFWLAAILTFFWTATFLCWGLYDFLKVEHPDSMWVVNLIILTVNTITYGSISIVFLLYPKMIRGYE